MPSSGKWLCRRAVLWDTCGICPEGSSKWQEDIPRCLLLGLVSLTCLRAGSQGLSIPTLQQRARRGQGMQQAAGNYPHPKQTRPCHLRVGRVGGDALRADVILANAQTGKNILPSLGLQQPPHQCHRSATGPRRFPVEAWRELCEGSARLVGPVAVCLEQSLSKYSEIIFSERRVCARLCFMCEKINEDFSVTAQFIQSPFSLRKSQYLRPR